MSKYLWATSVYDQTDGVFPLKGNVYQQRRVCTSSFSLGRRLLRRRHNWNLTRIEANWIMAIAFCNAIHFCSVDFPSFWCPLTGKQRTVVRRSMMSVFVVLWIDLIGVPIELTCFVLIYTKSLMVKKATLWIIHIVCVCMLRTDDYLQRRFISLWHEE